MILLISKPIVCFINTKSSTLTDSIYKKIILIFSFIKFKNKLFCLLNSFFILLLLQYKRLKTSNMKTKQLFTIFTTYPYKFFIKIITR